MVPSNQIRVWEERQKWLVAHNAMLLRMRFWVDKNIYFAKISHLYFKKWAASSIWLSPLLWCLTHQISKQFSDKNVNKTCRLFSDTAFCYIQNWNKKLFLENNRYVSHLPEKLCSLTQKFLNFDSTCLFDLDFSKLSLPINYN